MTLIQKLVSKKEELGKERDLCAEIYNVWITKLHDFEHDEEKYNLYVNLIQNLEPYGQMLKEEIRLLNREICSFYNVDSINETPHVMDCVYKYGNDKPNKEKE